VSLALVYECARSVDWIRADWQAFLKSEIPQWEVQKHAGGVELICSDERTKIRTVLANKKFPAQKAHCELVWALFCERIPQRLSASWFVEVLKLLPQFPTPWLQIPTALRTSAAQVRDFADNDEPGFSAYAPGEPIPTSTKSFSFVVADLKAPALFRDKLKRPGRLVDGWLRLHLSVSTNLALALYEDAKLDPAPLAPLTGF
jgi:hypothetical protein